jgi:uncharacterized protein YjdB
LPNGTVGTAYRQKLEATAGSGFEPAWSVEAGSPLPAGLTLAPDGTISGTPTEAGSFEFTVRAENAGGSDTKAAAITIAPKEPAIMTSRLPDGKAGTAYSQKLESIAGSGYGLAWSVESGNVPTGLTLAPDGTISGTPTGAGSFEFTVRAENASGSDTKAAAITIVPKEPAIVTSTLPNGKVGTAYSQKFEATADSGFEPVWLVESGNVPTGLTLASSGAISGTPTAAGSFTFTVRAENAGGHDLKTCTILIAPALEESPPPAPKDIPTLTDTPALTGIPTPYDKVPAAGAPTSPGGRAQLPAALTFPDGASADVTWTVGASGDTGGAAVDGAGMLTGVSEGTVTLVAASKTDPSKTATVKITIAKNVTKVRTPLTKLYLKNGTALTPPVCADSVDPATKKPDTVAKLTWRSGEAKVASVDAATGKITPKKPGKAVITATALNGKTLKITVYVVKKAAALKNVTFTKPPKSLKVGKTAILKAKAAPAKATNLNVTFKSNKKSVVTVDKAGKLTALKKGKAKITVAVGKKKYSVTITVK